MRKPKPKPKRPHCAPAPPPPKPTPPPPVSTHVLLDRLTALGRQASLTTTQLKGILMALADMTATLNKIDTATDNIAADLVNIKALIVPGMAQADVDTVQARLDAAAARLESIAADTADPVPAESTDPSAPTARQ